MTALATERRRATAHELAAHRRLDLYGEAPFRPRRVRRARTGQSTPLLGSACVGRPVLCRSDSCARPCLQACGERKNAVQNVPTLGSAANKKPGGANCACELWQANGPYCLCPGNGCIVGMANVGVNGCDEAKASSIEQKAPVCTVRTVDRPVSRLPVTP